MINMSLGGVRDPARPGRDTYSQLEADAVAYAVSKGVLVVAAVGNADQAPAQPWRYASYPAALPHVLGVSALAADGSLAGVLQPRPAVQRPRGARARRSSRRFPRRSRTRARRAWSRAIRRCGPDEYRNAEGTSFAAPQVTAAAANLLAASRTCRPTRWRRSSSGRRSTRTPDNGCAACPLGRDRFTGWGRLDATAALERARRPRSPPRDRSSRTTVRGEGAYRALRGAAPRRGDARLLGRPGRRLSASTCAAGRGCYASLAGRTERDPRWRSGGPARRTRRAGRRTAACGASAPRPPGERIAYRARARAGTTSR